MIYGDTDSVMVTFADAHDVHTCGIRGDEASAFVTAHFASIGYPEMMLEFEKVGRTERKRGSLSFRNFFVFLLLPSQVYQPYLLLGKKRYSGLKYEPGVVVEEIDDGSGNKVTTKKQTMVCKGIDCKGIETERRDTLPFVKDIMHGCLELLMYKVDEVGALRREVGGSRKEEGSR